MHHRGALDDAVVRAGTRRVERRERAEAEGNAVGRHRLASTSFI
jgi:hypothetical protein